MEMPRIKLTNQQGSNFERALLHVPKLKELYDSMYDLLWDEDEIEKEIKEKVRLLLANMNGCQTCMSLSYTGEGLLNEPIQKAVSNQDFSAFAPFDQQLFIFIEKFSRNPKEISEDDIDWLKQFFNEQQVMKLLSFIHLFDGFHKIIVSLDLYDFCSIGGSHNHSKCIH